MFKPEAQISEHISNFTASDYMNTITQEARRPLDLLIKNAQLLLSLSDITLSHVDTAVSHSSIKSLYRMLH